MNEHDKHKHSNEGHDPKSQQGDDSKGHHDHGHVTRPGKSHALTK